MSKMFQRGVGIWVQYRPMFNLSETDEINLHFGEGSRPHYESMAEVFSIVERGLKEAQRKGRHYLMFNHGWSPLFAKETPLAAMSQCSTSRKG
jgi:hypothetical protein